LRGYDKIWLQPGESADVSLSITLEELSFVGTHDDTHYILEDGMQFRVGIGSDTDCRRNSDDPNCAGPVTIRTENDYVGSCHAACNLWRASGCDQMMFPPPYFKACREACTSIHDLSHSTTGVQINNDGWGWTYVKCLESIVWNKSFDHSKKQQDCWKLTSFCRDITRTAGMDEFGSGGRPNRGNAIFNSGQPAVVGPSPTFPSSTAIAVALLAGIFSSTMIIVLLRGGFQSSRPKARSVRNHNDAETDSYGDVQFSVLNHDSEVC